jgi:hypothetical protein
MPATGSFEELDSDLYKFKLGQDEAVHDTELARWALRQIRGDK